MKRILSILLLIAISVNVQSQSLRHLHQLAQEQSEVSASIYPLANIISEYKFEDNVDDTVGSNDGTATAITYVTEGVGKMGEFNGSNSNVLIPDSVDLTFTDGTNDLPFSFTTLVYFNNNDNQIIANKGGATEMEWYVYKSSTDIRFNLESGGTGTKLIQTRTSSNISLLNTVHLTVTYDGSKLHGGMKTYFNGVLQTVTNVSNGVYTGLVDRGGDTILGLYAKTSTLGLNGKLDCSKFYNVALTQSQITDISAAELAGTDINP